MQLIRNKKIIIIASVVFLFVVSCLLRVDVALAQSFGSASDYLTNIALMTDLGGGDVDMPVIIGRIISGVLGFLGIACMGFIIYGGFRLMMAGGSEEVVQQARQTIKWALIGLIVVIGAYALSYYVVSQVLEGTQMPIRPEIPIEEENVVADCMLVDCNAYSMNINSNVTSEEYNRIMQECLSWRDEFGLPCCDWIIASELVGFCLNN